MASFFNLESIETIKKWLKPLYTITHDLNRGLNKQILYIRLYTPRF